MTVAVHGVHTPHPWLDEVVAAHDLDEDLYSLAVKRALAYGWSTTLLGAGALDGERWGFADAGGDWSRDGKERRLAWLTGYPAVGLRSQLLPVLPMARVLADALARVGDLRFTRLATRLPLGLAPDARFALRSDADWYALSAPSAATRVTVETTPGEPVDPQELRALVTARAHRVLRVEDPEPVGEGGAVDPVGEGGPRRVVFTAVAPEWTVDAGAWITLVVSDALRALGARSTAEIEVGRVAPER
ncbi:hypothetical protein BU197_02250 [Streptomyces sp. CBMA291]|nr:hypothetical protein [Streptomyces sp. CBMA291]MBD0713762.1 hypothetical protein [Streptomyces sp. CBMA370]